jgi:hypothetical protein
VAEEVIEGDVIRAGEVGVVLGDVVLQREAAVLGEQEGGGAGELLADAADAEGGALVDGGVVGEAGLAVAPGEHELAVADDRHREADEALVGGLGGEVGVDRGGVEALGALRCGRRGGVVGDLGRGAELEIRAVDHDLRGLRLAGEDEGREGEVRAHGPRYRRG